MNCDIKIIKIGMHKEFFCESKLTCYELQIDSEKCKLFCRSSITTIRESIEDMQKKKEKKKSMHHSWKGEGCVEH